MEPSVFMVDNITIFFVVIVLFLSFLLTFIKAADSVPSSDNLGLLVLKVICCF